MFGFNFKMADIGTLMYYFKYINLEMGCMNPTVLLPLTLS